LTFISRQKKQPSHLLHLEKHVNACPIRLTATAGTKICRDFYYPSIILNNSKGFQPKRPSYPTKIGWIRLCAHCPIFLTAATKWYWDRFQFPRGGSFVKTRFTSTAWFSLKKPTTYVAQAHLKAKASLRPTLFYWNSFYTKLTQTFKEALGHPRSYAKGPPIRGRSL